MSIWAVPNTKYKTSTTPAFCVGRCVSESSQFCMTCVCCLTQAHFCRMDGQGECSSGQVSWQVSLQVLSKIRCLLRRWVKQKTQKSSSGDECVERSVSNGEKKDEPEIRVKHLLQFFTLGGKMLTSIESHPPSSEQISRGSQCPELVTGWTVGGW